MIKLFEEYIEFVKTGEVLKLNHWNNEFEDYVQPFLVKGEWYRIKCSLPKEKKEYNLVNKYENGGHLVTVRKKKMKLYVIRVSMTHRGMLGDGNFEVILYDKIYQNGEIENINGRLRMFHLNDYKDVVIEHIESPELKKKEEELKNKMKDVDPYGEEEWND